MLGEKRERSGICHQSGGLEIDSLIDIAILCYVNRHTRLERNQEGFDMKEL